MSRAVSPLKLGSEVELADGPGTIVYYLSEGDDYRYFIRLHSTPPRAPWVSETRNQIRSPSELIRNENRIHGSDLAE